MVNELPIFRPPPVKFNRSYPPRSVISRIESLVCFENTTNRKVNIYWLDFNGDEAFYLTLKPNTSVNVNTYCYHPWIFRDFDTGQLMHILHDNIFWPLEFKMRLPGFDIWIHRRLKVRIHLPVRSLRDLCSWKVASVLRKTAKPKAFIEILPIPRSIKSDLEFIIDAIEGFVATKERSMGLVRRT